MNTELEILVQRCVDYEMSAGDRTALMERLERAPAGWRMLALAFVESQGVAAACAPRSLAVGEVNGAAISAPSACAPRQGLNRVRLWPIVAALLLGAGLGWIISNTGFSAREGVMLTGREDQQQAPSTIAENTADAESADVVADTNIVRVQNAALEPVMSVEIPTGYEGADPIRLPVYAAEELSLNDWRPDAPMPSEVVQALRAAGYRVDESQSVYSIPDGRGGVIALPVNSVRVSFAGI